MIVEDIVGESVSRMPPLTPGVLAGIARPKAQLLREVDAALEVQGYGSGQRLSYEDCMQLVQRHAQSIFRFDRDHVFCSRMWGVARIQSYLRGCHDRRKAAQIYTGHAAARRLMYNWLRDIPAPCFTVPGSPTWPSEMEFFVNRCAGVIEHRDYLGKRNH